MLWMLLVYVLASNGYNGAPALSPSFHGATFATKQDCEAAARTVTLYASPGADDVSKTALVTVCAPILPPPAPSETKPAQPPVQQEPQYPLFPPPPKHSGH